MDNLLGCPVLSMRGFLPAFSWSVEGAAFSWRADETSRRQHQSSLLLEPRDHIHHNISAQIVLLVRGGTHSFHHFTSLKADWKLHLYLSNWPKPSGMHSPTSLCKCLSFLTPTTFHKRSSPAPPLPTCCLSSQLCRALSSAVSREASHSPASCTLLERTPHHFRSAARQCWVTFF